MLRRSTVVVVILFLLLLAAALYLQNNPLPAASAEITPTPTMQAPLLPSLTAQDITVLELKQADGTVRVARAGDGGWGIETSESRVSSSPGKIEQARDELAAAVVQATLPENYALDAVGLDQPQTEITLTDAKGANYVIRVGSETPTGSGIYVQVNEAAPVVINSAVIETAANLIREAAAQPEADETGTATEVP